VRKKGSPKEVDRDKPTAGALPTSWTIAMVRLSETTPTITQDQGFWFDDGSVILCAETIGFRVHRSLLSKNSTIFRDMFAIGQPAQDHMIEGCPVVQLYDSPDDLRHFLRLIYETNST
jgi:hypothetical protein